MIHRLYCIVVSLFFVVQVSYSQESEVKCQLEWINGFENEKEIGHTMCGESTSSKARTKIYLTTKNGYLYVHSNFVAARAEFPTKIATTRMMSLEDVVINLFYSEYPSVGELERVMEVIKNNVKFIIDPKLIQSTQSDAMDFSEVSKLFFICPDKKLREGMSIKKGMYKPDYFVKLKEHLSVRIDKQNLSYVFSNLKKTRIDFNSIKILSLIENSSTKDALASKFPDKTLFFDYSNSETLKQLLLQNKNNNTIIIGHIESGDFVVLDSKGSEMFRISVDELQKFQKENGLSFVLLGCNSASEGALTGSLNKFNSVEAINRLATTKNTSTVEEFIDSLALGTIHFAIDESFFQSGKLASAKSNTKNNLPERIDILAYDKREEFRSTLSYKSLGKVIFLGLRKFLPKK